MSPTAPKRQKCLGVSIRDLDGTTLFQAKQALKDWFAEVPEEARNGATLGIHDYGDGDMWRVIYTEPLSPAELAAIEAGRRLAHQQKIEDAAKVLAALQAQKWY